MPISSFSLQDFFILLCFSKTKKELLSSLFFVKKNYNKISKCFSLQSGAGIFAIFNINLKFGLIFEFDLKNILMKKILVINLVLVFFISCKDVISEPFGNTYYFENPQPINDSELTSIPNKFQGIFMNSDSSYLHIKNNIILTEKKHTFCVNKMHLDSLKDNFEIVNGKFISKISKEIYNYKELKDSIQLTNKNIDTFFIFSNSQKAKRINGHLVISEKDSIFWRTKFISLNKKNLKITYIFSNDDLKKMDSITKNKSVMIDSSSFIFKPSRKEFIKFINLKHFEGQEQFIKISK